MKLFPQGTYMGQNFIPKALTILDPKTQPPLLNERDIHRNIHFEGDSYLKSDF